MPKYPSFVERHFGNFLEPTNLNLQLFNLRPEGGFCLGRAYMLPTDLWI